MISALSITLNLFCLWGVGIQGSVKAEVDKPDTSTVVPQDGTELDSASCGPNPEDMPDVSPEKSQNDTDSASCEPRLEVRQDTDNSLSSPNDNESSSVDDSQENDLGPTPFDYHFKDVIQQASLDKVGEPNEYFCPNFIPKLLKYFLPQAALWSRLLLGDLGRHGRGPFYEKLSKRFKTVAQKSTQNYTKDNMTQGIMEKSQWDLKKIRFQQKRLTRLDDFVHTYKVMHNALLREYQDSLKTKNKCFTWRTTVQCALPQSPQDLGLPLQIG
ncbi:hypothetical protein JOQ06_021428 [Pogonophryne albipinna]|uniref:Uncharacterized protein n=1 Tax=Pogonophryne albipinna TaxID=1090488 RepID=A0AAD6F6F4_9TELE|nr:hypothetical protein JOQ06_021428 [Pogonophryne albipinna]